MGGRGEKSGTFCGFSLILSKKTSFKYKKKKEKPQKVVAFFFWVGSCFYFIPTELKIKRLHIKKKVY